jgi:hypothetical protein
MTDPTYDPDEIESNPVWQLAFSMSELDNDVAPIGWITYAPLARGILDNYHVTKKEDDLDTPDPE